MVGELINENFLRPLPYALDQDEAFSIASLFE